jgi:hypothetical protein
VAFDPLQTRPVQRLLDPAPAYEVTDPFERDLHQAALRLEGERR